MRVKFQGSFTNGIYFSAEVSDIALWVIRKSGRTERRQSTVSGQSCLWFLRHVLLMASNCRVIVVMSPWLYANQITVIGLSALSGSALGGCGGKLRNSRCSCGNSAATVAELLLVFAGLLEAFAASIS